MTPELTPVRSTEVGLLDTVRADPDDDTVRLAYADWLDEQDTASVPCPSCSPYADDPCPACNGTKRGTYPDGGTSVKIPCHTCRTGPMHGATGKFPPGYYPARDPASGREEGGWTNCKTCNGGGGKASSGTPGFVLDTGRRDRAELIRVQVELAKIPPCPKSHHPTCKLRTAGSAACGRCDWMYSELHDRSHHCKSRETVLTARPEWLPACLVCDGKRVLLDKEPPDNKCHGCSGTGRVGEFHRGFLHVTVPSLIAIFERVDATCPDCRKKGSGCTKHGVHWGTVEKWQLTPWALALRAGFPHVVEVRVADREPMELDRPAIRGKPFVWRSHGEMESPHTPHLVPPFLVPFLPAPDIEYAPELWYFATADDARTALARAVARAVFAIPY